MTDRTPAPGERESPALALVNSLHAVGDGTIDSIADDEGLSVWLLQQGLAERTIDIGPPAVASAAKLRDAIREVLVARIEERMPPALAIDVINQASTAAPTALQLTWADQPQAIRREVISSPLVQALGVIAADAIELCCGDRHHDLLQCASASCIRLLLKDHPRRHFCSKHCGDRVRARSYYRRHRQGR